MLDKKVIDIINAIPWDDLEHAYGSANDAPLELGNLFSKDEVESSNAYYDWLMAAVFHQYTMYSATPGAIEVVLSMLDSMDVESLVVAEERADKQLLCWLSVCAESSASYPEVREVLKKGKNVYLAFISSANIEVQKIAGNLCVWCKKEGNK